ncbi:hypothetical protein DOE54_16980 [Vibrio cholerae]|uniref:Uncharacterized protein n=1 Tax=Vibrio cholerae TaxID=666 RepID=A0ABD7SI19_VIBCL|nr:hypothetical protein [Vibrio cholerae]OSP48658.1 hypothetical protein B7937_00670 [Vibrio cholerae]RAL27282.1 hypothetical protein DOE54_16980 [Vibrio cholerae]TQP45377.1 hypothetical protein FLM09_07895 [Vibrio cholerae]TQP85104.1 hypothetical protein FLL88_02045 [Vibrio cholerae]
MQPTPLLRLQVGRGKTIEYKVAAMNTAASQDMHKPELRLWLYSRHTKSHPQFSWIPTYCRFRVRHHQIAITNSLGYWHYRIGLERVTRVKLHPLFRRYVLLLKRLFDWRFYTKPRFSSVETCQPPAATFRGSSQCTDPTKGLKPLF